MSLVSDLSTDLQTEIPASGLGSIIGQHIEAWISENNVYLYFYSYHMHARMSLNLVTMIAKHEVESTISNKCRKGRRGS